MANPKKNIGATLALYPCPVIVVGAMVNEKPTWTLAAHAGIVTHSHLMVSLMQAHYHIFKPALFEFPTYEYFVTGEKVGNCGKMN